MILLVFQKLVIIKYILYQRTLIVLLFASSLIAVGSSFNLLITPKFLVRVSKDTIMSFKRARRMRQTITYTCSVLCAKGDSKKNVGKSPKGL